MFEKHIFCCLFSKLSANNKFKKSDIVKNYPVNPSEYPAQSLPYD